MAGVSLNSNIASLKAQRLLSNSTSALGSSFTRLSSGLRINRAKDDAAGLAISSSLDVDGRIFTQAIRNANDAIAMLNIAEGATREISTVLVRLKELASQAGNGTLSRGQRLALDQEASVLVAEYNRITQSTVANGRSLLNNFDDDVSIQLGLGQANALSTNLGNSLQHLVGAGQISHEFTAFGGGSKGSDVVLLDMNGDGALDLVNTVSGAINVHLSNGDASFQAPIATGGIDPYNLISGDFNLDGIPDVIGSVLNGAVVCFGSRDGTFSVKQTTGGGKANLAGLADFNQDGALDFVYADTDSDSLVAYLGNGDGSFRQGSIAAVGSDIESSEGAVLGDFNGDAILDVTVTSDWGNVVSMMLGRGDGTFSSARSVDADASRGILALDFNFDGISDLVTASSDRVSIFAGSTDGAFREVSSIAADFAASIAAGDLNGDGRSDLVIGGVLDGAGGVHTLLGDESGTFVLSGYDPMGFESYDAVFGDLNGDGVPDIAGGIGSGSSGVKVYLQTAEASSAFARINLTTVQSARAAFSTIDAGLRRTAAELASIGSYQSRLEVAVSMLGQTTESYAAAKSRIVDADVAEESAAQLRSQILQQIGAAVLTQANSAPALALSLLRA